jgi:hypothetical protein
MPSTFAVIAEEFEQELDAIMTLVQPAGRDEASARTRVAGANAAVLLLAATFEEYVRELAREYARSIVAAAPSYDRLPPKLASVAWKRTMEGLARLHLDRKTDVFSRESIFSDAQTRFTITYDFCRGDLTKDIYHDLIHNENNMRPQELNALFKLSGLGNVCMLAAGDHGLKELFGVEEDALAHARLLSGVEDFFDRRNRTAHELRAMSSAGPEAISADINLLRRFGLALASVTEANAPAPIDGRT